MDYEQSIVHQRNKLIVGVLWFLLIYDVAVNFVMYLSGDADALKIIVPMSLVSVPLMLLASWLVYKQWFITETMYIITLCQLVILFLLNAVIIDVVNLFCLLLPPIVSLMYRRRINILLSVAGSYAMFSYFLLNNGEKYFVNWYVEDLYFYFLLFAALALTMLLETTMSERIRKRALLNEQKAILAKEKLDLEVQQRVRYLAYHDSLTGLPNRNHFYESVEQALKQCERQGEQAAVIYVDLDNFKKVNDSMGHYFGDVFLKEIAGRLCDFFGDKGDVFRLGGDEFVMIVERSNQEMLERLAEQLLLAFKDPVFLEGQPFYTSPSVGISLYPGDGEDAGTIIKHADMAMYYAKKRGKNNVQFFTRQVKESFERKFEIENGLRMALAEGQFVLQYQPQMHLKTGEVSGVEALIRWKHPEKGFVSPGEFIPVAEESDLIVPIGEWVMHTACKQNKAWQDEGMKPLPVSVNVSVRQFQEKGFAQKVAGILEQTGLDAQFLQLEITESIVHDFHSSKIIVQALKELGVKVSIDDFGTGYSSLNVLHQLPFDSLKIDRSFISDIAYNDVTKSIVKTIIDIGDNLNFSIVAEGIETAEQALILQQYRCTTGQGYYFSRPVGAEEIAQRLLPRREKDVG